MTVDARCDVHTSGAGIFAIVVLGALALFPIPVPSSVQGGRGVPAKGLPDLLLARSSKNIQPVFPWSCDRYSVRLQQLQLRRGLPVGSSLGFDWGDAQHQDAWDEDIRVSCLPSRPSSLRSGSSYVKVDPLTSQLTVVVEGFAAYVWPSVRRCGSCANARSTRAAPFFAGLACNLSTLLSLASTSLRGYLL